MYKKIAITNRHLCKDLIEQIKKLHNSDYDYIVLREKDLIESEYIELAKKAIEISDKIILHTYISACEKLKYYKIHLPYKLFVDNVDKLTDYTIKGVSTHSVDEASNVEKLGGTYVTASHIFVTKCKEGLEPKGVDWLNNVCNSVNIPVYALGGINSGNAKLCIDAGAKGVCMMSEANK